MLHKVTTGFQRFNLQQIGESDVLPHNDRRWEKKITKIIPNAMHIGQIFLFFVILNYAFLTYKNELERYSSESR